MRLPHTRIPRRPVGAASKSLYTLIHTPVCGVRCTMCIITRDQKKALTLRSALQSVLQCVLCCCLDSFTALCEHWGYDERIYGINRMGDQKQNTNDQKSKKYE